ncbi:hypothetical protein, partial [Escherichia coli]|uniref:hypothetical protein n=1 Tax=Escherichia coli TaxID=562 RepID=UPI00194F2509
VVEGVRGVAITSSAACVVDTWPSFRGGEAEPGAQIHDDRSSAHAALAPRHRSESASSDAAYRLLDGRRGLWIPGSLRAPE